MTSLFLLAFMYAIYDWFIRKIKPEDKVAAWIRENESTCLACGSTEHSCLDCNILDNDEHDLGRAKRYSVPPNPESNDARKGGKYWWWRSMKQFGPTNRTYGASTKCLYTKVTNI
jgi:hypothetical protein